MPTYRIGLRAVVCACAAVAAAHVVLGQATAPVIPLVPGLTIVLAAHNTLPPDGKESTIVRNIAVGDSELVVSVTGVSAGGIDESTVVEGVDDNQKPLQLVIRRHVLAADLAGSRVQLLGFHTEDALEVSGTTSLGPSLAIVRDLRTTGRAEYSVIPFRRLPTSAGALTRVGSTRRVR